MIRLHDAIAVVAIACGVAFGTEAFAADTYTVTELATPREWRGLATGINGAGDVVGWIYPTGEDSASGPTRAVVWKNGVMEELETPLKGSSGYAYGLSSTGTVVGLAGEDTRAILWEGG